MPPGLYDLCIEYEKSAGPNSQCVPHSVYVIKDYKKKFRFAVGSNWWTGVSTEGAISKYRAGRTHGVAALDELARVLNLEEAPRRIECFDISNTQ